MRQLSPRELGPALRPLLAASIAALVYVVEIGVVHGPAFAAWPDVLSVAVAVDLVVVVPLVYWWLVVRAGQAPRRTMVPVVALSALGARLVLPTDHRDLATFARYAARYATIPLELLLLGGGVLAVRRALRSRSVDTDRADRADVADALDAALVRTLGDRTLTHVVAAEVATLYYALLARRTSPAVDTAIFTQEDAFPASLAWAAAAVVTIETAVTHLWIAGSHVRIAWTLTAFGAYALLWIAGHRRATRLRPVTLAGRTLTLRAGLRLSARLDLVDDVAHVEQLSWRTIPDRTATDYLDAGRPGTPNVLVTFQRPTVVRAALGMGKTVTRVGLCLDEPGAFVRDTADTTRGVERAGNDARDTTL